MRHGCEGRDPTNKDIFSSSLGGAWRYLPCSLRCENYGQNASNYWKCIKDVLFQLIFVHWFPVCYESLSLSVNKI